jgi:predicted nuclease of restriction endonuclease-like (RecB) superfamily
LSEKLNNRYGSGFSVTNLQYFRKFYLVFSDRYIIQHPKGAESGNTTFPVQISHQSGANLKNDFNPDLGWSHYRALMRVKDNNARNFYEIEAAECKWSKTQLERQIQTSYYERILKNKGVEGLLPANRKRMEGETTQQISVLKNPYVLEFLDLPDCNSLHENDLEQAIINNLQEFLLELGKGFCFVARQKHIRFDEEDFYIDLVFYNYIIKCFLLIDLKIGKLTHKDIGQMDGYVRMFEDQHKVCGDNPTIGLILCSDKSEVVAKYSVLSEGKQIFASKYLKFLPTEEELQKEIIKEKRFLETVYEKKSLTKGLNDRKSELKLI